MTNQKAETLVGPSFPVLSNFPADDPVLGATQVERIPLHPAYFAKNSPGEARVATVQRRSSARKALNADQGPLQELLEAQQNPRSARHSGKIKGAEAEMCCFRARAPPGKVGPKQRIDSTGRIPAGCPSNTKRNSERGSSPKKAAQSRLGRSQRRCRPGMCWQMPRACWMRCRRRTAASWASVAPHG